MSGWNLEGKRVIGSYCSGSVPITGIVLESRVKYGGAVQHTVLLDEPIYVYGTARERVLLSPEEIDSVN